jgi:hypothetical protein
MNGALRTCLGHPAGRRAPARTVPFRGEAPTPHTCLTASHAGRLALLSSWDGPVDSSHRFPFTLISHRGSCLLISALSQRSGTIAAFWHDDHRVRLPSSSPARGSQWSGFRPLSRWEGVRVRVGEGERHQGQSRI